MELDALAATEDALKRLQEHGSDLSKPMVIDFFVAAASPEQCQLIAEEASKHGFAISIEADDESTNWTCYCSMEMVPDVRRVMQTEELLDTIAGRHGGNACGFGSFGNGE